jgi:hypothetical protein
MGSGSLAVIHCNPAVAWQPKRAAYFAEGFKAAGIPYQITESRTRLDEGFPVLLGTTFWRGIERDGGDYLLVDRCSFGDTERFVSLVWNGHGRRGNHRVPTGIPAWRWERYGVPVRPWRSNGARRILCGQTETYSPHYQSLEAWYATVNATHFRPHPAGAMYQLLPRAPDFDACGLAITLNSSIGVQCVLDGIPTVTMDEAAMAWDVTSHSHSSIGGTCDRTAWCHWLAWTQYTDDEIREGQLWHHLLER